MNEGQKTRIIVIGGGFAGLQLIRHLKENAYDILLIDRHNHHQFQPLFYQVATSQIEPSSISFPLRKIFQKRMDVRIRMAEVIRVDAPNNCLHTSVGEFSYDILVVATGCTTNYYGNDAVKNHAFGLKSTHQAIKIRNAILENFERILHAPEEELESLFNIVVVGGGPTGVELSGAFAEIKRDVLPGDFHRIDFSRLNIFLVEAGSQTLSSMSAMAREASSRYLEKLGVILKLGVTVLHYDGDVLSLNNGEKIRTRNVIWAAGVAGNLPAGFPQEIIMRGNRIRVDRFNRVQGLGNVFALGDIAYMETPKYPNGHPQVANVAINQGRTLARNLFREAVGKTMVPYEYKDFGSMATIGRNKAVVDLPLAKFKGYFAWYVWMFLHLMLILSVRNKLIIFINWAFNYLTKNSSLRLILKEDKN